MYNKVAYIGFVVGLLLLCLIMLDWLVFNSLIESKTIETIILFITIGLIQLYYKLHTTPITEALSKWWGKRNKKLEEQKVENSEIKTYQDYKYYESENQ